MNKKLVSKLSILALTLTVSTSAIAPTITSAKTLKNLNSSTISKEIISDISLKYNLNESDMRNFIDAVNNEINNTPQQRGAVSTIKHALRIIVKYADLLPSWVANPLKNLFWPLYRALDKFTTISLSTLKKVMVSVGFNPRVADLIIDIIDSFFL
ncbi:TPA: hypothetical protein ACY4SM_003017 [Clostridium perfringens]|nr:MULTISPECIES: hypothetical protein [Clostridia]EIW6614565.1 hypothetical protein [Clostridium perfringens]EIW6615492.1 hypothetical protein [Clostridium perfringens]ELC8351261.1 hypothetical protein [Clostridium perfringens]ELC8352113.1 hypothetical protein [Clostridium perfringens]ELC8456942.1 hypothetical protein [Clostridium perfringens]